MRRVTSSDNVDLTRSKEIEVNSLVAVLISLLKFTLYFASILFRLDTYMSQRLSIVKQRIIKLELFK